MAPICKSSITVSLSLVLKQSCRSACIGHETACLVEGFLQVCFKQGVRIRCTTFRSHLYNFATDKMLNNNRYKFDDGKILKFCKSHAGTREKKVARQDSNLIAKFC